MAIGLQHLTALQDFDGGLFRFSNLSTYMNARTDGLRNLINGIYVDGGSWNPVLSAFRGTFFRSSSPAPRRDPTSEDLFTGILMGKIFTKGLVSAVSVTAQAPVDRVKLLLQNQQELIKCGRLSRPYNGIIDCFVRIIKNEGVLSLWKGNSVKLVRIFPNQVLNVRFHRFLYQNNFTKDKDAFQISLLRTLSDVYCYTCLYPLTYAHTRLANDIKCVENGGERQFNGLFDVYKKTLKSDGLKGIYRGFSIGLVGVFLNGVYDLKSSATPPKRDPSKKILSDKLVFIEAGLLFIWYAFETVQKRMIMTSGQASKYCSPFHAFVQIIKNEGIHSLYKGFGASILCFIPAYVVLRGYKKLETKPLGGISVVIETK